MLAVTGIRLGEVLGLQWHDVDFENGTITIKRAVDCRNRYIKETKTTESVRTLLLDTETLAVLTVHKEQQIKKGNASLLKEDTLMFPASDGRPLIEGAIRKTMNRVLKKAGLEHIRVHDLRHTAGSILLDEGVPLTTVSAFLGHSTPATTASVYAHAIRKGESIAKFLDANKISNKESKKP
ncbi:site-specific integrase [Desulfolucanica intricata]|uniref:site-specific integrase n=1 Tax=Desulfolucanica intricata TaxID=1285191 RepID=UPI000829F1A7|nr:site-specific integrase [Desulfolucanica intricata]